MGLKSWVVSHASGAGSGAHTVRAGEWMTGPPQGGEEVAMLKLGVLVAAVIGVFWLLTGGLFKLMFGFAGAVFGGLLGLFVAGVLVLLVIPIVLLAVLPLLLPALCVVALVWIVVRASQPEPPAPIAH